MEATASKGTCERIPQFSRRASEKVKERPEEETVLTPSGDAAESEAMENLVVVQLCNNRSIIGGLKADGGLEKTVESYQIIGQLQARVPEEQTITHVFYLKPISVERFQELLQCGPKVLIMDPFERDFSNQPALSNQMHPKLVTTAFANRVPDFSRQTPEIEIKVVHDKNVAEIPKSVTTAFAVSDHDGYAQSSTPANDVRFVYAQNLDEGKFEEINDDVPKKHIANAVVEALKVPNVVLEGNQMFVTSLSQLAAVGMTSSAGSVNSWVLTFFSIAAVTGFLGCLWAMYLQKNQTCAKWLSKIGAVGSTCAIIVALSMNFATDKNSSAVFTLVSLACIVSGALIIRS